MNQIQWASALERLNRERERETGRGRGKRERERERERERVMSMVATKQTGSCSDIFVDFYFVDLKKF
jgi:hypothetical protein